MAKSISNNPLAIEFPAEMAKRIDAESKRRGIDRTTLLLKIAHDVIVDPPKIPIQDRPVQVSFRAPNAVKEKLKKAADGQNVSIGEIMRESLKRWFEVKPF
jgi:predicted DNA-binding protein